MEEFFKEIHVLFHDIIDVDDLAVGEEETEHGADSIDAVGHAFFLHEGAEACFKMRADVFELTEAVGFTGAELAELRQASGHGKRVPGEGSRMVDWAIWREEIHDVRPAAESANR